MRLEKYTDRPNSFAYLQTSRKLQAIKNNEFKDQNPETNSYCMSTRDRLKSHNKDIHPFFQNSMQISMKRSSIQLSLQRNSKTQIQILTNKLQQTKKQLDNSHFQAQQTLKYINFLKQDLIVNKLGRNEQELKNQVKGLKNLLSVTKYNNEDRSKQLKNECNRLWEQTEEIREKLFNIQMSMDNIQDTMGVKNI